MRKHFMNKKKFPHPNRLDMRKRARKLNHANTLQKIFFFFFSFALRANSWFWMILRFYEGTAFFPLSVVLIFVFRF